MTSLNAIPPAFLVPAWSHAQLRVLSAGARCTVRSRRVCQQRAIGTTTPPNSDSGDNRDIFGTVQTRHGPKTVLTYASRRENRYQKGLEQIRERFLRKQDPKETEANYDAIQSEKRLEQQMIEEYQERKKQNGQPLRPDNIPIRRVGLIPNPSHHIQDDGAESLASATETKNVKHWRPLHLDRPENPIIHEVKQHTQPLGGQSRRRSRRSLLEELFPEEAAKLQKAKDISVHRQSQNEAPELPLPTLYSSQDDIITLRKSPIPRSVSTVSHIPLRQIPCLLKLENALPNLIEADFRRISPKGTHIEEWKSVRDPTAIVPARVESATESTGKYYLVFQAAVHAKAWRARIQHLHEIVSQHTTNTLHGEVIPPSGFKSGGEDVGKLLREYSIFSPDVIPKMTLYSNPQADLSIRHELSMISARLQPSDNGLQAGRSVVLWIDGWTLGTLDVVKQMITADGKQRHLAWGDPANKYMIQEYVEENTKSSEDDIPGARDKARTHQQRWMVTLRDQAEARRFVRAWHKRAFPAWTQHKKDDIDEPWPLVKAELLW